MTKLPLLALAAALFAADAGAQPAPGQPAPPPPRARGPAAALAVEAAQTAVATCAASTYKVTATVLDSAGVAEVVLTGDGAAERTQAVGLSKAWTTLKYKAPSGDIADKAKTDPVLDAAVKADPKILVARRGALPIMVGGEMIGAIAVSGAPGGDKDEVCAKAGLDRVAGRLM